MNILQQILILILGDSVQIPESPDNFSEKTKEILNRLKIKTPNLVQYLKLNDMKIKILLSGRIFGEEDKIEFIEKNNAKLEIYYFYKKIPDLFDFRYEKFGKIPDEEFGLIINCFRSESGIDTHFIYIAE